MLCKRERGVERGAKKKKERKKAAQAEGGTAEHDRLESGQGWFYFLGWLLGCLAKLLS
jgi:hypothetical protein